MTVYARYDGANAPDYITPGKLYKVENNDGREFFIEDDADRPLLCLWTDCSYIYGDSWTRIEVGDMTKQAHPAATILREIADEAAVNPEPHLAFEQRAPDGAGQEWHIPNDLRDLVDSACRVDYKVRRKPKTVKVEGEVSEDAIESAKLLVQTSVGGNAEVAARALLALVEA